MAGCEWPAAVRAGVARHSERLPTRTVGGPLSAAVRGVLVPLCSAAPILWRHSDFRRLGWGRPPPSSASRSRSRGWSGAISCCGATARSRAAGRWRRWAGRPSAGRCHPCCRRRSPRCPAPCSSWLRARASPPSGTASGLAGDRRRHAVVAGGDGVVSARPPRPDPSGSELTAVRPPLRASSKVEGPDYFHDVERYPARGDVIGPRGFDECRPELGAAGAPRGEFEFGRHDHLVVASPPR